MLDGWLARKLPPKKIIVLDPQPSKQIKALGQARRPHQSQGRCRPGRGAGHRGEAADRARRAAAARSPDRRQDRRRLDHGRPHARIPGKASARRRDRARHAEHAGRDRPRHHRRGRQCAGEARGAKARPRPARRDRRGGMGRRRGADGRGHRGVGLRAGLRVPARRGDGARPASRRACPRRWPTSSPARPSPAPANCCIARRTPPRPCARTSPRPAAPPPPRSTC